MAESRLRNGVRKVKETARREARMLETLKKGKMPFPPHVMSWVSLRLDKPSRQITQADVDKLIAK
jgi:hypothetical protein